MLILISANDCFHKIPRNLMVKVSKCPISCLEKVKGGNSAVRLD